MGVFFRSDTIFVPFLVHRAPKRKRGVVGAAPYSSIELLYKLPIYPHSIQKALPDGRAFAYALYGKPVISDTSVQISIPPKPVVSHRLR